MNILLVGEYSRMHNSLKEGLTALGHNVVVLGFNDGFKNYPVDLPFHRKWNEGFLKKIKIALYKVTGFDLTSFFTFLQFKKYKSQFEGYDVVQLINENSFFCQPYFEKKILQYLFKNNKRVFLLSCGDDFLNVKYSFDHPTFKSGIQPFLEGKIEAKDFENVLKFRKRKFRNLHEYLYQNISGIIASDMDYHLPLVGDQKYLGMIPNPINTDAIKPDAFDKTGKITIFLGINSESYFKKGADYFEKAVAIIAEKFPQHVEVISSRNIPYQEYMQLYSKAHIILDMAYAHDQGFNALEAMARGKVVFTGAEKEFEDYYQLDKKVNINAKPDVTYLVEQLSFLIENPAELKEIGQRAIDFVAKEHHYLSISAMYLKKWQLS